MAFWSSWQQWEKLSLILATLIILVMLYAYCVLLYNNWRVRRYAVTEARQKEGEAELYPILTLDDVPFGARALKRGVHVEGIWVANFDSPSPSPSLRLPSTPVRSQAASPMPSPIPLRAESLDSPSMSPENFPQTPTPVSPEMRRPPQPNLDIPAANNHMCESFRSSAISRPAISNSAPNSPRSLYRRNVMPPRNEKRAGFHTRLFRSSQMFGSTDSDLVPGNDDEYGTNGFARELGSRPPAEQNRASRMTRTLIRRRSSEEFRRRISQIFNESIHMNLPTGRLEFDPKLRDLHGRRIRESILEHFRSQHDETQVQQELPEET